ncbi:MAG TPA: TlpA disulfide reductase family protein [Nitrospirota bacterium]|nr:TlpA disulfide reductase family protein [Nitrospirota bacterium]
MVKRILAALILIMSILSGCTNRNVPSGGSTATDFTLPDLNGNKVKLSDYKGKVVLLEFWATWCPPCRASIPGIEKLHETYKNKGLAVLAVSLDEGGWDTVKSFVQKNGITYLVLRGNEEVAEKYQVRTIPLILILDKDGKISKRYLGFGNEEDLEKDIKAVL